MTRVGRAGTRPEKFRILIIGRANAGKTTILRAVCGAEGEPDVYDQSGKKITLQAHPEVAQVPAATFVDNEAVPDAILAERKAVSDATFESGEITPKSTRSVLRTTLRSIRDHMLCKAPNSMLVLDRPADPDLAPSLRLRSSREPPSSSLAPNSVLMPDPPVTPNLTPSPRLQESPNSVLAPSALRGEHNIEYSLMFPTSPGFIFHDSRGFESGAVDELELVREFIQKKASLGSMKNQLHAIWFCFATDSNRFMTAADREFFDTIDTGTVPVIAIFTKFDALDSAAFSALSAQGVPFEEAQKRAPEYAQAQFDQNLLPLVKNVAHPPKGVVCLRNMNNKESPDITQKAVLKLIESTQAALDNDALKVLLIQAQHINLELCMKVAVNDGTITKAAQDALQEDPTIFSPFQDKMIRRLFKRFPFIHIKTFLDENQSQRTIHFQLEKENGAEYDGYYLNPAIAAFVEAITPLTSSSHHAMSPPLQIMSVGCAAVIIAAGAFWLKPGEPEAMHITASAQHYIQSGTAEHVREAIAEAFQDTLESYDTSESIAMLQKVVLDNQMSHATLDNVV